ncbi:hypothetical protein H9L12_02390 [Sphingomonas rhizophila]|uniref:Uncharacterized protein n=1 Tax=Sphingomonas rhizophila TaxID=2071607 RepID=A0A7G9SC99_9SPHN|nr:hypothetical protein [Sphingomonas rhizophila]QNN65474.1 hypothetical protein H9L12_02390 [Sphingomonas rhizophila]
MKVASILTALALLVTTPTAAIAGANGFTLVNQSGSGITSLSIRRTGTQAWQPVGNALSLGARSKVAFADEDCAFDIRATLAGDGEAIWRGVNLCEVTNVTLQRNAAGATWVEYD